MGEESGRGSWWMSLPGVLTAIAALLTAVVGGVVALKQAGLIYNHDASATRAEVQLAGSSAESPGPKAQASPAPAALPQASPAATSPRTVTPEVTQVDVFHETYRILSAKLEPHGQEELELHLVVRITNNDRYDSFRSSDAFRLLVDSVPRAPSESWGAGVPSQSAKEFDVEFVFPRNAHSLVLRIISQQEDALIPLHLKS